MGLLCCCLCADDDELAAGGGNRRCSCLRDCVQGIMDKYRSVFERRRTVSETDHEAVPFDSEMAYEHLTAPHHADQTVPAISNPRNMQVSRDVHVVGGQDRESSRLIVQSSVKASKGKMVNAYSQAGSKERGSASSLKIPPYLVRLNGVEYFIPSSEDEDVCPTCLEEYTEDNPKIMTHCSHHYHLGCIYEWMERSDACPVCGKVMEFDE